MSIVTGSVCHTFKGIFVEGIRGIFANPEGDKTNKLQNKSQRNDACWSTRSYLVWGGMEGNVADHMTPSFCRSDLLPDLYTRCDSAAFANFVAAISHNWFEFVWRIAATKLCCSYNHFYKISGVIQRELLRKLVPATCRSDLSPSVSPPLLTEPDLFYGGSTSGQDESNLTTWLLNGYWILATWAILSDLARSRSPAVFAQEKLTVIEGDKSFIDKAWSVKVAVYWLRSSFACSFRSMKMQTTNEANRQRS